MGGLVTGKNHYLLSGPWLRVYFQDKLLAQYVEVVDYAVDANYSLFTIEQGGILSDKTANQLA